MDCLGNHIKINRKHIILGFRWTKQTQGKWIEAIKVGNHQDAWCFIPGKTLVCELHFEKTDYRDFSKHALKTIARPTVFDSRYISASLLVVCIKYY